VPKPLPPLRFLFPLPKLKESSFHSSLPPGPVPTKTSDQFSPFLYPHLQVEPDNLFFLLLRRRQAFSSPFPPFPFFFPFNNIVFFFPFVLNNILPPSSPLICLRVFPLFFLTREFFLPSPLAQIGRAPFRRNFSSSLGGVSFFSSVT